MRWCCLIEIVVSPNLLWLIKFQQAFTLFEQELSESRAQLSALSLIVSTLSEMQCLDLENFQVLRTQCTRAASHLLLRPDQSRAVAVSCQLFWGHRNSHLPDAANIVRSLFCRVRGATATHLTVRWPSIKILPGNVECMDLRSHSSVNPVEQGKTGQWLAQ